MLGPLDRPGFVALIAIILCYSMAFGLLEIGMTAYATEKGNAALAGILLGLMSTGSALGGIAYGSRSWHLPLTRQDAGVVMAPALIIQSMLIAKTARPDQVTEAFTWSASALLCGVGIGVAVGGGRMPAWSWRPR